MVETIEECEEWTAALTDEDDSIEVEDPLSPAAQNLLIQQGMLFTQLLQSEKFVSFVNMNYDLVRDEEQKTLFVVEVPDTVAAERAMAIMKQAAEAAPLVQTASTTEAKKLLNDPEFLKKVKAGK